MNGFENWWYGLSKGIRILLIIITFGIMGFVARLIKFINTKDTSPLIGFILCLVPIVGFIMWIIDIISVCGKDKFGLLYEVGSMDEFTKSEAKDDKADAVEAEATEVKEEAKEETEEEKAE